MHLHFDFENSAVMGLLIFPLPATVLLSPTNIFRSKIKFAFCFDISAQLDGVTEKAIKRLAEHHNINDWLELEEASSTGRDSNGKRKVFMIFFKS